MTFSCVILRTLFTFLASQPRLNEKIEDFFEHKENVLYKNLYICVSEEFSFAKIILPPDRSFISRRRLNNFFDFSIGKWEQIQKYDICVFVEYMMGCNKHCSLWWVFFCVSSTISLFLYFAVHSRIITFCRWSTVFVGSLVSSSQQLYLPTV